MTRDQLEHIIRASAEITDQYEFVIVGSQSILGAVPNPAQAFTASMEADIYPLAAPELADDIDGAIGEGSNFQELYGYYAQGVGPDTAVLPADWIHRVHRIQSERGTNGRLGLCLDLPDLFLSKAWAGRGKDREFCMAMLEHGYAVLATVVPLVDTMPLTADEKRTLRARVRRWAQNVRAAGHDVPAE